MNPRWYAFALIAAIIAVDAPLAETKYREALNAYWKKEFKEDGFTPLYYASTTHGPKSVWVRRANVSDYFSAGLDLLPEARVPVQKDSISLPDSSSDRTTQISAALQLARVKDVADVELDALASSTSTWTVKFNSAEMHYFGKLDARRTMKGVTAAVLRDYLAYVQNGERLFQVVKAVYVEDAVISVSGERSGNVVAALTITPILEKLGFEISSDRTTATKLTGSKMYFAAGFRELTESGLTAAAANQQQDPTLLPLPFDVPVETLDRTAP